MTSNKKSPKKHRDNTLAALLKEKPSRGRPRSAVPRQSVYVSLSVDQKGTIGALAKSTPAGIKRADIPDMAVMLLTTKLETLRNAVAGRDRELPEGITDMRALYYLWDLGDHKDTSEKAWTSIRLSPNWAIEFGRLQGQFNALFGANRSDVFELALVLLDTTIQEWEGPEYDSLETFYIAIN